MGFQDRDYERYEPQYRDSAQYRDGGGGGGFMLSGGGGGGRMMVTNIAIICLAIFLIDAFTQKPVTINTTDRKTGEPKVVQIQQGQLSDFLALKADLFTHPWQAWQLLTYGFAHASLGSPSGIWHVLFNMFTLWMLGRMVEMKYGRKEFLTFYLVSIVFSGLAWVIFRNMLGQTNASCVGAQRRSLGRGDVVHRQFSSRETFDLGNIPDARVVAGCLDHWLRHASSDFGQRRSRARRAPRRRRVRGSLLEIRLASQQHVTGKKSVCISDITSQPKTASP